MSIAIAVAHGLPARAELFELPNEVRAELLEPYARSVSRALERKARESGLADPQAAIAQWDRIQERDRLAAELRRAEAAASPADLPAADARLYELKERRNESERQLRIALRDLENANADQEEFKDEISVQWVADAEARVASLRQRAERDARRADIAARRAELARLQSEIDGQSANTLLPAPDSPQEAKLIELRAYHLRRNQVVEAERKRLLAALNAMPWQSDSDFDATLAELRRELAAAAPSDAKVARLYEKLTLQSARVRPSLRTRLRHFASNLRAGAVAMTLPLLLFAGALYGATHLEAVARWANAHPVLSGPAVIAYVTGKLLSYFDGDRRGDLRTLIPGSELIDMAKGIFRRQVRQYHRDLAEASAHPRPASQRRALADLRREGALGDRLERARCERLTAALGAALAPE